MLSILKQSTHSFMNGAFSLIMFVRSSQLKAEDNTKPGLQAERNRAHHYYTQKKKTNKQTNKKKNDYSDDVLSVSSLNPVRQRNILFVFMVCPFFFRLQSGLSKSI